MNNYPNAEYNEKVGVIYNDFLSDKPFEEGIVREEIMLIWKECKKRGIEPNIDYRNALSKEEYADKLEKNKLLCDIALPFMQQIYSYVPGPCSLVSLTDENGTLLRNISDGKNPFLKRAIYQPGDTNIEAFPIPEEVFLCKKTLKPAYCFGNEHYISSNKSWGDVAAPILDENNNLMAILVLSDKLSHMHYHSVGIVAAAAKAIENEIRLSNMNQELRTQAKQLSSSIEAVPYGMLVLDNEGYISHINSEAIKMLGYPPHELYNAHITSVLKSDSDLFRNYPFGTIDEQDTLLDTPHGSGRYYISTSSFDDSSPETQAWTLLIIKNSSAIHKLANNLNSSYARYTFDDIVGQSEPICNAIKMGKIASKSSSNVLITGPSGTGKELFAHSIHSASSRKNGPFISVNCGALPSGLVESELFGFEGGSFTGAKKSGQVGKFELANHGTIFLDEIGEMPLAVQAAVLRAIDSKEVTRIGGNKTTTLDVRIIAATNKDLLHAIEKKEFREDLYYRLNVLRIMVPPLVNRPDDILLLCNYFIAEYSSNLNKFNIVLSDEALEICKKYPWKGNVRELENIIERAVNILDSNSEITSSLMKMLLDVDVSPNAYFTPDVLTINTTSSNIKEVERDLIIKALQDTNENITKAAQKIGMSRRTLYRKIDEYNIFYRHKK